MNLLLRVEFEEMNNYNVAIAINNQKVHIFQKYDKTKTSRKDGNVELLSL